MTNLAWLEQLPRFSELRYNLYRCYVLLSRFVPGWQKFNPIIITGSNGKGTAAVTAAEILRRAGFRTGLYTSPHLMRVGERINLNQGDIEDDALEGLLGEIRRNLPREFHGAFLHSEVLLTAALMWFQGQGADYLVLEAGLGGRLDSVNVFPRPLATAITSVSLEHGAILGPDVNSIAREKAGIVKKCRPLVTAAEGAALEAIRRRTILMKASLIIYGRDFGWREDFLALPGREVRVEGLLETPAGRVNRAIGAVLAVKAAAEIPDSSLISGVREARLPGRFQVIPGKPLLILDVAHNAEGMANLVAALNLRYPRLKKVFVLGIFADKPVAEIIALASRIGQVFYAPPANPRAYIPQGAMPGATVKANLRDALAAARKTEPDLICVSGSFASISELYSLLSG